MNSTTYIGTQNSFDMYMYAVPCSVCVYKCRKFQELVYIDIKNIALVDLRAFKLYVRARPQQHSAMHMNLQIRIHQLQNDCLTGKKIRKIISDFYHKRTGTLKEISRDWIIDFRKSFSKYCR